MFEKYNSENGRVFNDSRTKAHRPLTTSNHFMNGTDHGDFWHIPNPTLEEDIIEEPAFVSPIVPVLSNNIAMLYSTFDNNIMNLYYQEGGQNILIGTYDVEVPIDMERIPVSSTSRFANKSNGGSAQASPQFRARSGVNTNTDPLPSIPFQDNQLGTTENYDFNLLHAGRAKFFNDKTLGAFNIYHATTKVECFIPPCHSIQFQSNVNNDSTVVITPSVTFPDAVDNFSIQAQHFGFGFSGGDLPPNPPNILSENTIHDNNDASYITGTFDNTFTPNPNEYEDNFSTSITNSWTFAYLHLRYSFSNISSANDRLEIDSDVTISPVTRYKPRAWLTKKAGFSYVGLYYFDSNGIMNFDYYTIRSRTVTQVQTVTFNQTQQIYNLSTYGALLDSIVRENDVNFNRALRQSVPFSDPSELNVNYPSFDGTNLNARFEVLTDFSTILSNVANSLPIVVDVDADGIPRTNQLAPIEPGSNPLIQAVCAN